MRKARITSSRSTEARAALVVSPLSIRFWQFAHADLFPRQLAVIDGRVLGCGLVGGARGALVHQGLVGAAKPVGGAGLFGSAAQFAEACEMLHRGVGLAQIAQRDPAGEEFGFKRITLGEAVRAAI